MKCTKCKKNFNPRDAWAEGNKITSGYDETLEFYIECPHCKAGYSHWVQPTEWDRQES